jgi:hypothetical protein
MSAPGDAFEVTIGELKLQAYADEEPDPRTRGKGEARRCCRDWLLFRARQQTEPVR